MSLISVYSADDNQGYITAIWGVRPVDISDEAQAKNIRKLILF